MQRPTANRTIFSRFFNRACRDTSGNVLMIFGLSAFVIMGFVGAAIDLSRVDLARRHLQDAADAAVLRTMSMTSASDSAREQAADRAFNENFSDVAISAVERSLVNVVSDNNISQTYHVSAVVKSYFGALFGKEDYPVTVVSQAQVATDQYEIAFVLDTTGSMEEANKMPNLKTSVDSALASLLDASGSNVSKSKVAFVPFANKVRLGAALMADMTKNGLIQGKSGDCVTDRSHTNDYDASASPALKGVTASQYVRSVCDGKASIKEVQGLSDDIGGARKFVKTLSPEGGTNITIGMQWGMEVLSPDAPFVSKVPFHDKNIKKVMIVVTDGLNTLNSEVDANPLSGKARTAAEAKINARTKIACQNAKALGIIVYTVKVIEGNSDMLRACATSPDMFYDLTNATQLNSAMSGIFKSIYKTHLTR